MNSSLQFFPRAIFKNMAMLADLLYFDSDISLDSNKLTAFLEDIRYDPKAMKTKAFSDCIYKTLPDKGISFCFDKKDQAFASQDQSDFYLGAIHVFNLNDQYGMLAYDDKTIILPHSITSRTCLVDFVRYFSPVEPEKGGGGRSGLDIWIKYKKYGITCSFNTKNWEDGDAIWTEIIFHSS